MIESYNPIISTEELSRWRILDKVPIPDANTALVFVGDGQSLLTITEGQKGLTRGEILWGRYSLVYKVNLSDFPLTFGCKLPCATDAFYFLAEVQFTCSVSNPAMIVSRNVTDIRLVLEPLIIDEMRRISRKYKVEQSGAAEQEISAGLETKIYDEGFNFKHLTIRLSLEEEARERIRQVKRIQEEHELEKTRLQQAAEIQRLKQETEQELTSQHNKYERQEVKSSLLDEMEKQMLIQNLEKQRTQFELEQARQREQFQLEQARQREQLQLEMMKQKTEFYSAMLQAGQWQLLAMQLAQRPEDVHLIKESLYQQKLIEREHQVRMLKMLIDTDAVEGWQLSEVGKRALQELMGLTEQTMPVLEEATLEKSSSNNTETQPQENIPTAEEVFPDEQ